MRAAQKMAVIRSAIDGFAKSETKAPAEQKATLDSVIEMLREVANDETASEDDRASAVRMLKAVGASVVQGGGDESDEGGDKGAKAMGSEARYIARKMNAPPEARGVRLVGSSLEFGPMTNAQALARLRAIEGQGGR